MYDVESIAEAIRRLNKLGYKEDFRALGGRLRATPSNRFFEPRTLKVDEIVRFEGETDLNEEAAIFALSDESSGLKGTYTVAYSTDMDPADMDVVQKLKVG
jgi:hypothetical protein